MPRFHDKDVKGKQKVVPWHGEWHWTQRALLRTVTASNRPIVQCFTDDDITQKKVTKRKAQLALNIEGAPKKIKIIFPSVCRNEELLSNIKKVDSWGTTPEKKKLLMVLNNLVKMD